MGACKQLVPSRKAEDKAYNVVITSVSSERNCVNMDGTAYILISRYIQIGKDRCNINTCFLESFNNFNQANSYVSYLKIKFIRFLFLLAKNTQHIRGYGAWVFIPNPTSARDIRLGKEGLTIYLQIRNCMIDMI